MESKKASGDASAANVRAIVETAKKENMPKDAIERAILKGTSQEADLLESIAYETYGPGGVAIIISTLTDNRNRTAQEIKHLLSELGLELAPPGSAAWAFKITHGGYEPETMVTVAPENEAALTAVLDALDAYEDTEDVYTNAQ